MKLAIIIGVSHYQYQNSLSACENDVNVMHGVFQRLNKFDDICIISNSPKAFEAKQKLTEFINQYKSNEISELVFYYSGHGARFDDDFFYLFSDFKEQKKEVTGLRNTELDGLIRNLNPELTVKIVDACFSGSTYVKSEGDIKPYLEKSAKENNLNKLYFFHSSSSEETSLASDLYSYFTFSFCKSLSEHEGAIRYRDIMAYVADDMSVNGYPKPTFVVQADNTELFGELEPALIDYAKKSLNLEEDANNEDDTAVVSEQTENSLLELVKAKSIEEYCSQEEASNNISIVRSNLKTDFWPPDITNLFSIQEVELEATYQIPNEVEIGRWIHKNIGEGIFAEPKFETKSYFTEEYKKIPKKPNSGRDLWATMSALTALGLDDNNDYKLEKIEKKQEVIKGFEYTAESPFHSIKITFTPLHAALENYSLTIVVLFSRKTIVIFSAKEVLPYTSWDNISHSKCFEWKVKNIMLKDSNKIGQYISELICTMSSFITEDISSKLNN